MSQQSAVESRLSQNMRAAADYQQILSQPKPTFAALDKTISDAADSVDLTDALRSIANEALKNQLFLSPRLSRWQLGVSEKGVSGYWLKNSRETATVTVTEEVVLLSCPDPDHPKYPFKYEVMTGLNAATLYKSIQDAQAIVQPRQGSYSVMDDDGNEFFEESDPEYIESAGLDAALEETHSEPLVEDDAELIQDITAEQALNADQRREDGPAPIITVSQKFIDEVSAAVVPESFTAKTNRKNATTDGVECEICGNLNRDAYRGACPQCPKKNSLEQRVVGAVASKGKSDAASRFKSLQGRVLTIIDGTFSDKTQREAVKQMINKEFRREITKAGE